MREGDILLCDAIDDWRRPTAGETQFTVGLMDGEGVGSDLVAVVRDVIARIEQVTPYRFDIRNSPGGAGGGPLNAADVEFFSTVFDAGGAVLCGPRGGRFVYELRREFDLYCKFAPIRPCLALSDVGVVDSNHRRVVDIVVVRENARGVYLGEWGQREEADETVVASHSFEYDSATVSRILEVALNLAERRRRRLCLVVKPGGVPTISALWSDTLAALADGRGVEVSTLEVDTAAYQVVVAGPSFDVIVAPNLFGDIIADVAAVHLPTRGMSYSGNFGPAGRAVYQTGHGAAYDLAGSDTANPIGQVQSLAMMLRESFGLVAIADVVDEAINVTVGDGWRTADIQSPAAAAVGTREMGDKIAENTAQLLRTARVA